MLPALVAQGSRSLSGVDRLPLGRMHGQFYGVGAFEHFAVECPERRPLRLGERHPLLIEHPADVLDTLGYRGHPCWLMRLKGSIGEYHPASGVVDRQCSPARPP